jgi:hypothetical protein
VNRRWLKRFFSFGRAVTDRLIGWGARLIGVGSAFRGKRRFCLIDGRPVRAVYDKRGQVEIQEFNPENGRFERNTALMTRVLWGGIDVDYVSKKVFYREVSRLSRNDS